ncbi:response regulator [Pengzhenrongella sp.]|jgi:two-component system chemotaxis response regulator CheY|uniref:response regulator n=1 Tax=Pengzhenrongella sp. TaxID=2888820 RepID=UPI002F91F199
MLRVVIADDSRVMRQIIIRTLRQAGYDWDITEASDGDLALDIVTQERPDLVLSDWNMPSMNGIDLLRALRANGDDVPFAFITSESSAEMRQQAESAGALFLIAKPFTADSFRDAIEPVLA